MNHPYFQKNNSSQSFNGGRPYQNDRIRSIRSTALTVTADELCRDANTKMIDELVNDQLKAIDEQIRDEHEKHRSSTIFELTNVFIVENMPVTDIQLMVYGTIIEELESKGYTVQIKLGQTTSSLHIKWYTSLDEETKNRYSKLIEQRKIKK